MLLQSIKHASYKPIYTQTKLKKPLRRRPQKRSNVLLKLSKPTKEKAYITHL